MAGARQADRLTLAAPVVLALALVGLLFVAPAAPDRPRVTHDPPGDAASRMPPPAVVLARIRLPEPPGEKGWPAVKGRGARAPAEVGTASVGAAVTTEAPDQTGEQTADPAATQATTRAADPAADPAAGQAMLRAVAAGTGPGITLSWPRAEADRRRVAAHLARCGGLTVALMAEDRLWRLEEPAGQSWHHAGGDLSPVIRRPDTDAAGQGGGLAARIRRHHGLTGGGLVALVSRAFDSRLLGGLARMLPAAEPLPKQVSAAYGIAGDRLLLTDLRIDGHPVGRPVGLGRIGRCD